MLLLGGAGTGIPSPKQQTHNVYISLRKDGRSGSGTKSNPFDGSTAAKMIAILRKLPSGTHLKLAAGTYQIDVADVIHGGFIKEGWEIQGAGENLTTIQFTGSLAGINAVAVLSTPPDAFASNVTISDLTVDCNWPNLANTATTGKVVRTFTGSTTIGTSTITGMWFTPMDIGQVITGAGIPPDTWIGAVADLTHATLSSSATSLVAVNATSSGNGSFTISSKRGAVQGIVIYGSNNLLNRVRVINSYGSSGNNECFALTLAGSDYNGVQKPGTNNWIVNCDAELPWGTYANPFAAFNTYDSGVLKCRATGINDGYDGRGWTSGGVNGANLRNFVVKDCRFTDTYGVFYIDTGSVDGLEIVNNTTVRGKMGCAIVNSAAKKNIRIINNRFNLQNRSPRYPTTGFQFLRSPAASNVVIRGNSLSFDRTGIGVDLFRTLHASTESLDATARVEDNVGPLSQVSKGDPGGLYKNNRDMSGISWFGPN